MTLSPIVMSPFKRSLLPQRINNLGLWLDASIDSSFTFNANGVSQWRDLSGNNRHFSQITAANQPDSTRKQNGLRVIDFGGTQWLNGNAATLGLIRNVAGLTILCVTQRDGAPIGSRTIDFSRSNSTIMSRINLSVLTTPSPLFVYSARRPETEENGRTVFVMYDTDPAVLVGTMDFSNAIATMHRNGVLTWTNNNFFAPGSPTENIDSLAASIGALTSGQLAMDGYVAEIIVYRRALSSIEIQRLSNHLMLKWGL